jgi:hypothetical protein
VRDCLEAGIPTCIHANLHTCLPEYMLEYLNARILVDLPACINIFILVVRQSFANFIENLPCAKAVLYIPSFYDT